MTLKLSYDFFVALRFVDSVVNPYLFNIVSFSEDDQFREFTQRQWRKETAKF